MKKRDNTLRKNSAQWVWKPYSTKFKLHKTFKSYFNTISKIGLQTNCYSISSVLRFIKRDVIMILLNTFTLMLQSFTIILKFIGQTTNRTCFLNLKKCRLFERKCKKLTNVDLLVIEVNVFKNLWFCFVIIS